MQTLTITGPPRFRAPLLLCAASLLFLCPVRAAVLDVIGSLSASDFTAYIAPQSYRDWGNEPSIAVNPINPQEMVMASFGYGSWISSSTAQRWHSSNGGAAWTMCFSIPTPYSGSGFFV